MTRSEVVEEETEYYVKSAIRYLNEGSEVWNFTDREEDRTIGLFMNTSWQTAYLVNTTFPIETIDNDTDGNKVAVLRFPTTTLEPAQNISCIPSPPNQP